MAFNPLNLAKLKPMWGKFKENHPKFPAFLRVANKKGLKEGSVISITIDTPDGEKIASNIKLNAQDMDMIQTIRSTFKHKE